MTPSQSLTWLADALCTEVSSDLFFPVKGDNANEARDVCRRCPCQTACLAYALTYEAVEIGRAHGIYGGLTPVERRKLLRARRVS